MSVQLFINLSVRGALVVAVTASGIYRAEPEQQCNDALARALGLDMSKWWTATGPSYFNHVSKRRILDVVTEAVDANAASPLAALKKDAAVTGAEQTVAGTGWLPTVLCVQSVETVCESDEVPEAKTSATTSPQPDEETALAIA